MSLLDVRSDKCELQTYEFTCGAAALATTFNIFGFNAGEGDAIAAIYLNAPPRVAVSPEGEEYYEPMSLADLERGAKTVGFKAVSLKVRDANAAVKALEKLTPVIARLRIHDELLHFVVVRDIESEWVSIADPGYGNVRMPISQFLPRWQEGDGVMLAVGTLPFRSWKDSEGRLFVQRDPSETKIEIEEVAPIRAFRTSLEDVMRRNVNSVL